MTVTKKKYSKKQSHLYATVLAGGIGSRFWPLSRETTPKQILKVVGEKSLLRATLGRLQPLIAPENTYIVTSARQAEIIRQHLSYEGKPFSPGYIIEPEGRNTAPAIGLAALELIKKDPDAIMAVLPADHIIGDAKRFRAALKAASSAAAEGRLVTFGIVPTKPETGYGYIKAGRKPIKKFGAFKILGVDKFVEKPDEARAREYLESGDYLWNSGIFVWKASRILEEIAAHLPGVNKQLDYIRMGGNVAHCYKNIRGISIDHGVLEKSANVAVIPADFKWSDIGSWNSFSEILDTDPYGNVIKGKVVDIGSSNSIIFGNNRLIATIGLKDFIIVDTPDATLVCPRDRAQDVKNIVDLIKRKGYAEHEFHVTVNRPWGTYTLLEAGPGYKIKKIQVNPGKRLSLQIHNRRSEHWVVITGTARVQRGDEVTDLTVNQSTYIPTGVKHRLENPLKTPLELIEVQSGNYLEEDDIIRLGDDFERK